MSKPIVVSTIKATAGYPKGAELGFQTEAKATSVLGEGTFKVTRYQNGEAYEGANQNQPPSLRSMTRAQLDEFAAELGIEGEFANKDEVIAAIEAHQEDDSSSTGS